MRTDNSCHQCNMEKDGECKDCEMTDCGKHDGWYVHETGKDLIQYKHPEHNVRINVKDCRDSAYGCWVIASHNPDKGGWKEHGYAKTKKEAIAKAEALMESDSSVLHGGRSR